MQDHDSVPLSDFEELPPEQMLAEARAFLERMKTRHSIRQFSDKPVAREVIEAAILAAGRAPNGANHQPWFFSAIGSAEKKKTLREMAEKEERAFYEGRASDEWLDALSDLGTDADKPYLETAPWIIAVFGQRKGGMDDDGETQNYYVPESVGIAMGFLIASLHHAGLAMLTHTPKPMSFLNDLCGRPKNEKPYLLLVVGYPAEDATVPTHALKKKPLDRIASFI
ncbi:nitroreductase family protein [Altererythrobacter lutimaris]|uniref:Nitroreductase family protein n=1 Tax=Altererythrobacter lutimaris TaxID=2743979 RepID=A0A850HBW2_9SPHN|nr:nitroreductase family protein [Altererythrobacter lutimaris]NVE95603.1 nitroreductase family protein [Altererythrobacter lutimaris]